MTHGKLHQWLLILFLIIPAIFIAGITTAQESTDDKWLMVQNAYQERMEGVKQSFIQGHMSFYFPSDVRYANYELLKKGGNALPNLPDPNRVLGFSWFTDRIRWRLDICRAYPSIGDDCKQISYDGEKYSTYDEQFKSGSIGAERPESITPVAIYEGDFTTFSKDVLFGANLVEFHQKYYMEGDSTPTYEGEETVNGESCQVFRSQSHEKYIVTYWYSPQKKIITKMNLKRKTDDSGVYIVVLDSVLKNGYYIPTIVKEEMYLTNIKTHKVFWALTRIFEASKVEINNKEAVGAFQNNIRVTSRMVDILEAPDKFFTLGGNIADSMKKVAQGDPPPLEREGISADGRAPEVVQAQVDLIKQLHSK